MKYRKKPVVIEAVQFTREMAEGIQTLPDGVKFCQRSLAANGKFPEYCNDGIYLKNFTTCHRHIIETLEGNFRVDIGDWVIKGIKGEFYPCKPDIFEMTYEQADCERTPDNLFIAHIKNHLKPDEKVICKICGKTADEITKENSKCLTTE